MLINSIDAVTSEPQLQTVINIEVPAHSAVSIPTRKSGTYTSNTPGIYEVQFN